MENKKVRNARAAKCDGIDFKSQLELRTYQKLRQAGFDPRYEELRLTLQERMKPRCKAYDKGKSGMKEIGMLRELTYTPDFVVDVGDRKVLVECKGYKLETYAIKKKLTLAQSKDDWMFFEVHNLKDVDWMIDKIKSTGDDNAKEKTEGEGRHRPDNQGRRQVARSRKGAASKP